MNALLSEARAKVGHRLAMHLRVDLFRLRNSTPMVSFTFDDLPKSAVTTGAQMLEAHGARGTFYVSGSLVGADAPDWVAGDADDVVALHRRGHDIGCHTFSHQRACDLDEAQINNGWLIFYGHDVTDRPSPYGCTPALLAHALRAASRRNIPALTMAEAMQCARA